VLTEAIESGAAVYDDDEKLIDAMLMHIRGHGQASVHADCRTPNDPLSIGIPLDEPFTVNKTRTVRVSLALLDKLMNGVSDMVLARNEVSRQLRKAGRNNDVEQSFSRLSASVAEMRDAVGSMRMQNIDKLFSSLPRLVRDIAIALGKEIELRIDGSEVEVDREMVEALRDPLTHILRNAADHGIESAAERRAAGKDPIGHIHITARQSGNQIVIDIIDDGRGINVEKLGVRAIAAKAVTASGWNKMSTRAQLNTIFTPGLSTADIVTSISGRGVGMDVVQTNLQSIGGTIELENHEGQGLKMTLRLPLTLSIMAGLSVRAGGQIFGIARSSVVEMLSATNANAKLEEVGGRKIACIRGKRYPFKALEDLLGVDFAPQIPGESRTLIVMRPAVGESFVLEVAAVIDNEELVVKPGAPLIMATGLFAGTSLPDNGKPMLLLDPSGIAAALGLSDIDRDDRSNDPVAAADAVRDGPLALLFIAMNGSKQALRLSAIDRMEDVDASAIRFVGGRMRVWVDDALFDVWELDTLPADGQVKLLKLSDGENCCYLAVRDVLDIFSIAGDITPSSQPDLFEGIIRAFDEHVELRSIFALFETSDRRHRPRKTAPLCFIDCAGESQWERTILAPLLSASGYSVSFDPSDHSKAAIVLHRDIAKARMAVDDPRTLHLRDSSHVANESVPSIYRYDRPGLISAIEDKLQLGAAA